MKYGNAVRVVRSARGWSQKDLASRAGLDGSYVSLIEKGQRVPSLAATESLVKTLGVPMHLFMLLAGEKKDLRGISEKQAGELGTHLLRLLIESQPSRD